MRPAARSRRLGRQLPRQPDVGLMIWTLIVFGLSLYLLSKVAFPRIAEALDKRQRAIEDSIDTAERTTPRGRRAARASTASGSPTPATRPTRSSPAPAARPRRPRTRSLAEARAKREEMMEQTRRDIEAETRRAIQQIRAEVADLTVLATEKVTRKSLDADDQKRLVEEALGELDFAALASEERELAHGRDRRGLRPLAVRGRPGAGQARRRPRAARRSSPTRSTQTRELQVFFFSPYFSTTEKEDGLDRAVTGRRRGRRQLPQAADREPPHAGRSSASAASYDRLWEEENKLLPVSRSPRRSSSTRPPSSSIGDRDRRADRSQGRARRRGRPRHPRRHRRPRRQLRSSTPPSATASNNFASRSPRA